MRCKYSRRIRKGKPLHRFYVQIEFKKSITEAAAKKILEFLGSDSLGGYAVNVKGYCLLPNGKTLYVSLAPIYVSPAPIFKLKYDMPRLERQIEDVLSLMNTKDNLSQ